jgi:serine/threonine-protein kinase
MDSLAPKNVESRVGQRVKSRYELKRILGLGGQGAVYLARDLVDRDDVAVKVLHDKSNDPVALERMYREAIALVTLWSTHAVRVLDQGWTEDGCFAIVMELLHGEDLGSLCDRIEGSGEKLSIGAARSIFAPVVVTLERAHEHGIIHRDLKPGNIFIVDAEHGGGIRVLDFGFAKFLRMGKLTAAGMIAGSPTYLAPETWLGLESDSRVDVYALAVLIFRTLAGKPPFSGSLPQLLATVPKAPRPSLHALRPDLPAGIDDWVEHGLAIDRDARFQTARGLWNAFLSIVG